MRLYTHTAEISASNFASTAAQQLVVAAYEVQAHNLEVVNLDATTFGAEVMSADRLFLSPKGAYTLAYGPAISQAVTARQGQVTITGAGALAAGASIVLDLTADASIIAAGDLVIVWQGPAGAVDGKAQGKSISIVVDNTVSGSTRFQITNFSAGTYTAAGGTDIVLSYLAF